jgi:hypothetical protein
MDDRILIPNATRSIVFGIVAWPVACLTIIPVVGPMAAPILSALFAFAGLAAGISALRVINREPEEYSGMGRAVVGTTISTVGTLVFGGYVLFLMGALLLGAAGGVLEGVLDAVR